MNVREIAYASLLEICKDNGYSNIIVSKAIRSRQFNDRDRRFYTELVYGTVRTLNYLDWIIGKLSTRRIRSSIPFVSSSFAWDFIRFLACPRFRSLQLAMNRLNWR